MLAVGIMAVVMMFGFAAMIIAGYLTAVHRARSAADLAALSGAAAVSAGGDACDQARRTARSNTTVVVACDRVGDQIDFVVTVRVAAPVALSMPPLPRAVEALAHSGPG
jgi:secretion/DNA translocation related TadE-like protein